MQGRAASQCIFITRNPATKLQVSFNLHEGWTQYFAFLIDASGIRMRLMRFFFPGGNITRGLHVQFPVEVVFRGEVLCV